jgi:small-conductance mechanosensitive channel
VRKQRWIGRCGRLGLLAVVLLPVAIAVAQPPGDDDGTTDAQPADDAGVSPAVAALQQLSAQRAALVGDVIAAEARLQAALQPTGSADAPGDATPGSGDPTVPAPWNPGPDASGTEATAPAVIDPALPSDSQRFDTTRPDYRRLLAVRQELWAVSRQIDRSIATDVWASGHAGQLRRARELAATIARLRAQHAQLATAIRRAADDLAAAEAPEDRIAAQSALLGLRAPALPDDLFAGIAPVLTPVELLIADLAKAEATVREWTQTRETALEHRRAVLEAGLAVVAPPEVVDGAAPPASHAATTTAARSLVRAAALGREMSALRVIAASRAAVERRAAAESPDLPDGLTLTSAAQRLLRPWLRLLGPGGTITAGAAALLRELRREIVDTAHLLRRRDADAAEALAAARSRLADEPGMAPEMSRAAAAELDEPINRLDQARAEAMVAAGRIREADAIAPRDAAAAANGDVPPAAASSPVPLSDIAWDPSPLLDAAIALRQAHLQRLQSAEEEAERAGWERLAQIAGTILGTILLILVIRRRIARKLERLEEPRSWKAKAAVQRTRTVLEVGRGVVTLALLVAAAVIVLTLLEVSDVVGTWLLGSVGILALAVSFGAQSILRDFLSGLFILLENHYLVGDWITIDGTSGTVERIGLRTTILRDLENNRHIIANGSIVLVTNKTARYSGVALDLGLSYDDDPERVFPVLEELCRRLQTDAELDDDLMPRIAPPRVLGIQAFDDSAIVYRVTMTSRPGSQWKVARRARRLAAQLFREHGLTIPFPQRTIHMAGGDADEPASGGGDVDEPASGG